MFNIELSLVEDKSFQPKPKEHFLQTRFWANFKSLHGWKAFEVVGNYSNSQQKKDFTASVLVRNFAKKFSIAYIPLGIILPQTDFADSIINYNSFEYLEFLKEFSEAVKSFLPKNTFCIRIDPPINFDSLEQKEKFLSQVVKKNKSIKKSLTDIQPPDTVLLDLSLSEDDLLSKMKQKWRYNIRLAEKKGVVVNRFGTEKMDDFYKIFTETSVRDGIAVHGINYYNSLLSLDASKTEKAKTTLYIAEHEGDILAGIITLFTETEAIYLYGASSNQKRNLMATYLLQWEAIKDAKAFGSKVYDFYGIPPVEDENHPMYGLYRFKTGFGGKIVHRIGSLDFPTKKLIYALYAFAEKARAIYFKKIKKLFIHKKK